MIRSKRVSIILGSIVLGIAATSVTIWALTSAGSATANPDEPPIGAIRTVNSGADIKLPIDSYNLPGKQESALMTASVTIGQQCMKQFGLSWPAYASLSDYEASRNDRRYSVIDPAEAKTRGYHPPEEPAVKANGKQPSKDAMNVWGGQGEKTFRGKPVPEGGCGGEAVRKLTDGAPKINSGLPEVLQLSTFVQMKADSRVHRAYASWSACMEKRGYHYADPWAAVSDKRWETAKPTAAEIATATADVDCKSQTQLPGLMLAVETAYQNRAIAHFSADLAALKTYNAVELANLAKLNG